MRSKGEVFERWREAGRWWLDEPGLEITRYLDERGVLREDRKELPRIVFKKRSDEYFEDNTEDWDVRVRKQRDIKVAKACGWLQETPIPIRKGAASRPYVPLHVLTGYAFGRSTMHAEEVAVLASVFDLPSVAIADPFSLMGAVEFARAAKKANVKPLIGASFEMEEGGWIVLIAKNKDGYHNLSRLITECHLNEPRLYPLCNWGRLERFSGGVLCLTGGDGGIVNRYIARRELGQAVQILSRLIGLYGKDNVFVEIERSYLPWEIRVERAMSELAEKMRLRAVAGGKVTHARPDQFPAQDILVCVDTLCTVEEIIGRKLPRDPSQPQIEPIPQRSLNAERYLRTPSEMAELFCDRKELLDATLAVVEMCDDDVLPARTELPSLFPDDAEAFREIVWLSANERYRSIKPALKKRLALEIERIVQLGFATHFLIAWDMCRWAKEQGILFSGRGSVVDSVVAYCLGFSRIDAFEHNLHFDRFLPGDGSKRPDIDIDFEARRREDVRQYLVRKYGEKHVATVAAIGSYRSRGIIREVGKALELPPKLLDYVCKRMHGGISADRIESALDSRPELRGGEIPKEKLKWIFRLSERLMDLPRNARAHSSGVVISKEPIANTVPVMISAMDGVNIIQWDKRSAKHYFDKFDVLCLRGQDVLAWTHRAVAVREPSFNVGDIPLDDEDTYRTMRAGQLIGIPQSASPAMRQAHIRLRTANLKDASLVQAGIRPGVGGAVKINELIARRRGKPYSFSHPELERILGHSYGIVVFQEQVDQLLQTFARYTPGEAEEIRESIYEKRREKFAESIEDEVVSRIVSNGFGVEIAREVYDLVAGFQGYGFAQGHALAFAEISIRSIYCQQNFPAEYFASLLNAQPAGYYGPCTLVNEARARGVRILPPCVNRGKRSFTVEDAVVDGLLVPSGAVRVGLSQIFSVSSSTIERIVGKQPFLSLRDFVERVGPSQDELEMLVLSGALDGVVSNRRAALWCIPKLARRASAKPVSGQLSLPISSPEIELPNIEDFSPMERAIRERIALSLDISQHLMAFERERIAEKGGLTASDIFTRRNGDSVLVVGNPIRLRFPPTKSGRRVLFFDLEDETGLVNVTCFDETYQRYGHAIVTCPYVTVMGTVQDRDGHMALLAHKVLPYRPIIAKAQLGKPVAVTADYLMR